MSSLIETFFERIPGECHDDCRRMLSHDWDLEQLRSDVDLHLNAIIKAGERLEFLPVKMARQIAEGCQTLLARSPELSDEQRTLVFIAAAYFVLNDDAESDTTSVTGLDDDAEVFNIVAELLDQPQLKVDLL